MANILDIFRVAIIVVRMAPWNLSKFSFGNFIRNKKNIIGLMGNVSIPVKEAFLKKVESYHITISKV